MVWKRPRLSSKIILNNWVFLEIFIKIDDNEVRIELLELNQKYEDLEHTYNIAKEVSESMTDDWRNSELRAREFEKLYEQEKMMHQIHVKDLMDQFEEKERKWVIFIYGEILERRERETK